MTRCPAYGGEVRLLQVLIVDVADIRVGWPAEVVDEVLRMVAIDELPGSPEVIAGVVDVRGRVAPVLDLRRRLGIEAKPPTLSDRLVSVRRGDGAVLVWVDGVHGLEPLDAESIEPLVGDLEATAHLSGVVRGPGGLLYIQDPDAFVTSREIAEVGRALARVAGER